MADAPPAKDKTKAKTNPPRRPSTFTPSRMSNEDVNASVEALLDVLEEIRLSSATPQKVTEKRIRARMYFICRVPNYERSIQLVTYFSKEIYSRLGPEWKETPFYEWLEGVAKQPLPHIEQEVVDEFPNNVMRRGARRGWTGGSSLKTILSPSREPGCFN